MVKPTAYVLCADDYGYRPGVSAAIARLARLGRLSATSALVTFASWASAGEELGELSRIIDIGLHLNFVEGPPLGPMPKLAPGGVFPGIGTLVARVYGLGSLDPQEIRSEAMRQVEVFYHAMGRYPDFIDGHQHAHALPIIDAVIANLAAELVPGRPIPVRDPSDALGRIFKRRTAWTKAATIAWLTRGFAAQCQAYHVPINEGFSGVYDLKPCETLGLKFASFFDAPGKRPLIMCHPGDDDGKAEMDPIRAARQAEANLLASDEFARILLNKNASLKRFS